MAVTVGDTALKRTAKRSAAWAAVRCWSASQARSPARSPWSSAEAPCEHPGRIERAAVDLAKEWRTDRHLARLDATLCVVDRTKALLVAGSGEVVEPEDGLIAAGSGGIYALSAARALVRHTQLPIRQVVEESLRVASDVHLQ
jgi:ATP-dependent HslUV protease subunit HslV